MLRELAIFFNVVVLKKSKYHREKNILVLFYLTANTPALNEEKETETLKETECPFPYTAYNQTTIQIIECSQYNSGA